MLKRTLLACSLASLAMGAAFADTDTKPVEIGRHECVLPHGGKVDIGYTISATGAVEDVRVLHSSGDASVDESLAKCVAGRTYQPATHNGVAVAFPTHIGMHIDRIENLNGPEKAFALLERDADRRCHKLYPIDRRFLDPTKVVSRVTVSRLEGGEIQFAIAASAGEAADAKALRCLKEIVKDHDDLPPAFARDIEINWSHR